MGTPPRFALMLILLGAGGAGATLARAWLREGRRAKEGGSPVGVTQAARQRRGANGDAALPACDPKTTLGLHEAVRLARTRDRAAIPMLRGLAFTSRDPLVAGNALRALGRLRAAGPDREIAALLRDSRPRVRQEAVIALGRSGDPSGIDTLVPLLREGDPALRPLVIQALGRLGGERARGLVGSILRDPSASEVDRVFAREALRGG